MRNLIVATLFVAACGSKKPQPAPAPAPAPEPAAAVTEPAPAPAPEPAPAPAPPAKDDRADALAILDKIDQHLKEAQASKAGHGEEHSSAIVSLVSELEGPMAAFPQASKEMTQLKTHASKFDTAARKKQHKDQDHHRHDLVATVKKLRASL